MSTPSKAAHRVRDLFFKRGLSGEPGRNKQAIQRILRKRPPSKLMLLRGNEFCRIEFCCLWVVKHDWCVLIFAIKTPLGRDSVVTGECHRSSDAN